MHPLFENLELLWEELSLLDLLPLSSLNKEWAAALKPQRQGIVIGCLSMTMFASPSSSYLAPATDWNTIDWNSIVPYPAASRNCSRVNEISFVFYRQPKDYRPRWLKEYGGDPPAEQVFELMLLLKESPKDEIHAWLYNQPLESNTALEQWRKLHPNFPIND